MKRLWPIALLACGSIATSEPLPGQPPLAQPGTPPTTNVYTFAVHEFFLGDTSRDDTSTQLPDAWKTYGFDLDGKITTATSTDVCSTPNADAYDSQLDGNDGIDNAFGHVFVPNLGPGGADLPPASFTMSRTIQAGGWTLQIQVEGLSDDPAQSSEGLVARFFSSGAYDPGHVPAFDESTSWPVLSSSLTDGQSIAGGAVATFPAAYVIGGTFVSGPAATLPLRLAFQGVPLELVLHDPVVTFVHAAHADAIDGTIAGVVDVQELLVALYAQASHISTSLCGPAFDGIAQQIEAAADILADGTNAPGVACTGVSIGFGFNAKLIANPTTVTPVAPLTNLCSN